VSTRKRIIATDAAPVPALASSVSEVQAKDFELRNLTTLGTEDRGAVEVLLIEKSSLINEHLFEDFPNARILQSMSAGVDFINISSIPTNVILCSNAGAYKDPIVEHVFAMILFFAKNLTRNHERLSKGIFDNTPDGIFLGGKTIGIIGAGGIGQSVARVAKALNMRTLGINTSGSHLPDFDEVWKMDGLEALLKQSNFVVVSIPLNVLTRNLINAERLKSMKEDAILVNVARGPIISQADLYGHLKAHPRFGAGIDVWWMYPKKGEKFSLDFPFFELPNFLASPHVADAVPESNELGQKHAFENVLRYVRNQPLQHIVDKADYREFTGGQH
jgi:phosphoglycerate dehydrogenase-like enzyme